ncbi:tRNA uracil 4-sulfurtransferase ThiI [Peptoniphilus catoniae]|uniref:tRNA uracil 4-sulfurtransferase ThiI n=1 Tax=Peptoniphilus catoniae TaxID=1660341 RepID=UPI0010FDC99E|nr:tRNA uracil 4-sulfurtransferase ThiI [Peptoniphilus catoniae]
MERVVSLSLGEVMLKGNNRKSFIDQIIKQIKRSISDIEHGKIYIDMGKIYISAPNDSIDKIIEKTLDIFGIVYASPCIKINKNMEEFEEAILKSLEEGLDKENKTFKAHCKRSDKSFPIKSMDLNREIGAIVLKNTDLTVDVHNPDIYLYCDIKKDVYIYTKKHKARGGLPLGTNGKGLLLLSGGIDSPVAGYMMAKRGIKLSALHFHSYPFTSKRAEEKVHNLARILSRYSGRIKIYSVNLLPIQKEINKNCPEREMTIISRRFMMRIARKISIENGYKSIITGENLGQVASQTIDGLNVTNSIADMLVFRPLIGMDKIDIINIANKIGTYETSIQPFEDCCTVFLPKHPVLRPKPEDIEASESLLEVENLVESAIKEMKIVEID